MQMSNILHGLNLISIMKQFEDQVTRLQYNLNKAIFAAIPTKKPVSIKMTNGSTIENQNAHTFLTRQH